MLSSVAHEFRNPLNSVNGNLDLISLLSKDKKIKEFASIAKNSCLMINSYVEDILDLSKIEKGVFKLQNENFKIKDMIMEVEQLFDSEAKNKCIGLTVQISDALKNLEINADKNRLRQVLINLVSNALKFTSTVVQIECYDMMNFRLGVNNQIIFCPSNQAQKSEYEEEEVPLEEEKLNPGLETMDLTERLIEKYKLDPHHYIFMCVKDDGDGILPEDQGKLFKLFGKIEKTHRKNNKGCGLGLTICKKIIEKMEGKIDLVSNSRGSIFGCCFKIEKDYILFPESRPEEVYENMEKSDLKKIDMNENYLKSI